MAYIQTRAGKRGTRYQVRWRDGGGRDGQDADEWFDDEESAQIFRDAVNASGQRWPAGWVKGRGFITEDQAAAEPDPDADAKYRFEAFATRAIENRTGIEEHYRKACLRDLQRWIFPTFGTCDVRSSEHFSSDTVRPWVRELEKTKVWRGRDLKPMSPKTIRNLHGLLSSVLEEAVQAEPPLRARNPCRLTTLPRTDDQVDDEMVFLTPEDVQLMVRCLERRQDQLMLRVAFGTGLRYGEITALKPGDITDLNTHAPKLKVSRAWKKDGDGGYYLGPPKTKKSRRTIRISLSVVEALVEAGLHRKTKHELLFPGAGGGRLHYSTFGDRWARAVARAQELGMETSPTFHSARHGHVATLISQGQRNLAYVQRRLGHESIQTTIDRYGHLLPEADDDAMDAIEASLAAGPAPASADIQPAGA